MGQVVVNDMVVSMDYTLCLDDGQVVDSSEGREPLEFLQGHGQIISGLEQRIAGMALGEERDFIVPAAEAYGERYPDLVETLPRSIFPPDVEVGMGFRMRTEAGQAVIVYVDSVEDDQVVVNLNHPLAGKDLYFHVKIVGLREATPDELGGSSQEHDC